MDALTKYVQGKIGQQFEWGVNDCLNFADEAVKAIIGRRFCGEWVNKYSTERGAALRYERFLRNSGYANVIEAVDAQFDRILTLHPPHGALVAREVEGNVFGYAFGVSVFGRIFMMSDKGVIEALPSVDDIYWVVE